MKVRRFTGRDVRRVLIAMISNKSVLSHISRAWEAPGLFDSTWSNLIGSWCVSHLEKFGDAPDKDIVAIFEDWAKRTEDEATINSVEKFLFTMSEEAEPINIAYTIDLAAAVFDRVRLRAQLDHAETELDQGRLGAAYERIEGIRKINLGGNAWLDPTESEREWEEAFQRDFTKPLINYPGGASWISQDFVHSRLISFMAPDKSGKSFYLMDAAYRAARRRYRVAFFDSGDMGMDDVLLRLGSRAARHPLLPQVVEIPQKMIGGQIVQSTTKEFTTKLTGSMAHAAIKKTFRGEDRLRISCYANSSLSVADIDGILGDWERDNWVADMVVIDYADILAMRRGTDSLHERVDELWKALRRLSQERHCLVLTATQSAATAYGKQGALSQADFSDSKKKLAHVNGMIGINVKDQANDKGGPSDKELGISRLNWIVRRGGVFTTRHQVPCAGALALGCPVMIGNEET